MANLVNYLDRERFEPVIICMKQSGDAANWLRSPCRIVELEKKAGGNDPKAVGRLSRCLSAMNVKIIQSHNWATLMECAVAQRIAKIPYHIYAEHGGIFYNFELRFAKRFARRWLQYWAMRGASKVVTIAERTKQILCDEIRFPIGRVAVIANGIEPPPPEFDRTIARADVRKRCSLGEMDFVIGSVGRLVEVKGFDVALRALAELPAELGWKFLLVGGGDQRPRLEALAQQLGIQERVVFAGEQSEMHPWYAAMDLFVNSSHSEGMCLAIIEAMSHGLPVVATDVGDNAQLVGDVGDSCGRIVPPNDAKALSDGICQLAQDANLLAICSRKAGERYHLRYTLNGWLKTTKSFTCKLHRDE